MSTSTRMHLHAFAGLICYGIWSGQAQAQNPVALLAPKGELGMSRSLLNIEKRSLPWLTLCGFGLASKDAVG